jgi:hypothetical protein
LHEETPIDYREAVLPFVDAAGWKRLRFPRVAPARVTKEEPKQYYRGVSPQI